MPRRHPLAFALLVSPALIAVLIASVIDRFVMFHLLFPGIWCSGVAAGILHDLDSGNMRFRGLGWSVRISRGKAPVRFWGTIGIWSVAYLFALAFPIGYALQERGKRSSGIEQGTGPAHP